MDIKLLNVKEKEKIIFSSKMSVSVCISVADAEVNSYSRLSALFPKYPVTKHIQRSYSDLKNLQVCLSQCPKKNFCLFLKDDSITNFSAGDIDLLLRDVIKNDEFDIFMLCRWMDKCEKYSGFRPIGKIFSSTRTFAPSGLQAVLINPIYFERILEYTADAQILSEISSTKTLAFCCLPNLFEFDTSRRKSISDVYKTYSCASVYPTTPLPRITTYLETKNEKKTPAKYEIPIKTKPLTRSLYETIDSMDYLFLMKVFVLLTIVYLFFSLFSRRKV